MLLSGLTHSVAILAQAILAQAAQVCSQANRHFGRTFKAMAGLFKAMLAVLALCCGGEMNRDDDGQWFVQCRVYCILLTVPFFVLATS